MSSTHVIPKARRHRAGDKLHGRTGGDSFQRLHIIFLTGAKAAAERRLTGFQRLTSPNDDHGHQRAAPRCRRSVPGKLQKRISRVWLASSAGPVKQLAACTQTPRRKKYFGHVMRNDQGARRRSDHLQSHDIGARGRRAQPDQQPSEKISALGWEARLFQSPILFPARHRRPAAEQATATPGFSNFKQDRPLPQRQRGLSRPRHRRLPRDPTTSASAGFHPTGRPSAASVFSAASNRRTRGALAGPGPPDSGRPRTSLRPGPARRSCVHRGTTQNRLPSKRRPSRWPILNKRQQKRPHFPRASSAPGDRPSKKQGPAFTRHLTRQVHAGASARNGRSSCVVYSP